MQAFAVPAAEHQTAGKFVHDDDLAVLDHIVHVAPHGAVGLDGLIDVVGDGAVFRIAQIVQMEKFLRLGNAAGGQRGGLGLFIHDVVGVDVGVFLLLGVGLRNDEALQLADEGVRHVVELRGLVALTGDDQRGTGFIDQDGVHLVHDGKVVAPLHQLAGVDGHIVTQIVKAHLVVGAIGDVGLIGLLALLFGKIVNDQPHAQSQEAVNLAHPLRVTLGQIVIDGDDMDALAGQRIQIGRQRRHQRFALTGLHLGDAALVQHDTAHQLYRIGTQTQHTVRRLTDGGESLRQDIVQGFTVGQTLLEFRRLGLQLGVGQRLVFCLHVLDLMDDRPDGFQFTFGIGAEQFCDQSHVFVSFLRKEFVHHIVIQISVYHTYTTYAKEIWRLAYGGEKWYNITTVQNNPLGRYVFGKGCTP